MSRDDVGRRESTWSPIGQKDDRTPDVSAIDVVCAEQLSVLDLSSIFFLFQH